ncbi:MAG: outer membrane beta-barrel domain-containing protein [Bradymonadaceae bacterium]|nr:outer membrane beta-barrel domain-containing protein [Lujinxingiaceae bacterium]
MVKLSTSFYSVFGRCLLVCLFLTAAPVAAQEASSAEEASTLSGDSSSPLYWAEMRDVYTVQKRVFEKEGRWALSLYGGLIPNNIFETYFPIGARLNYFILENIGVEFATAYAFKSTTSLKATIQDAKGVGAQEILIGDSQLMHTNFGIVWSPFYGKVAFYDRGPFYFDVFLVAGAGIVLTQTQKDFNAAFDTAIKPEGVLGGGMALYFGRHLGVRADFRQFVFEKVAGGVANPSEVSVGASWFF